MAKMTKEAIVAELENVAERYGFTPTDIERIAEAQLLAGAEDSDSVLEAARNYSLLESGEKVPTPEEIAEQQKLILEGQEALSENVEPSDEQAAAMEADPDLTKALNESFLSIAQARSGSLLWTQQVATGITPDDILADSDRLYDMAVELGYVPRSLAVDESTADPNLVSQMKSSAVSQLLSTQGPQAINLFGLWVGSNPEAEYLGENRTNGHLTLDLLTWANNYTDGNTGNALALADQAKAAGLPEELYIRAGAPLAERIRSWDSWEELLASTKEIAALPQKLEEGQKLYESPILQLVHANNPDLAAKMNSDWFALTQGEIDEAVGYVGSLDTLRSMAGVHESEVDWLQQQSEGGGAHYSYDEASVIESARAITQSWNLEFDDDELLEMTQAWKVGQSDQISKRSPWVRSEDPIQSVTTMEAGGSPDLAMREVIRNTPNYEQYFGQKPGIQSEEQYVSRFENESQRLFGDVMPEQIQAGMQAGNLAAVGSSALLTGAGQQSSRFKGKMADMANVFKRMT